VAEQQSVLKQRKLSVKRARHDLEQTKLVAPYDGVLSEVYAQLGKRLGVNDKAAHIIDPRSIEVHFTLSNAQYGRILEQAGTVLGREVKVTWTVGKKSLSYIGHIKLEDARIEIGTGGVKVFVELMGIDMDTFLRPGAFVEVEIKDRSYTNVIAIPDISLHSNNTIYVIKEQRLQPRDVQVIGYDSDRVLIRSRRDSLIEEGELILASSVKELGVDIKVEVRKAKESALSSPRGFASKVIEVQ
jgi:RND family efflux transporter MFP subunit